MVLLSAYSDLNLYTQSKIDRVPINKINNSTHFSTISQPICYENYSDFSMLCKLCFESFTLNLVKCYFQT